MQKKDKGIVIPFLGGLFFPLEKIFQKFKAFFLLVGGFSFLSSVLAMIFGRSFACGLGFDEQMFFCESSIWSLVANFLCLFVLVALFIHRWWLLGIKGKSLKDVFKVKVGGKDLKIIGFLFLFFCFWAVLGAGLYILSARKATPNLDFELAFFVFVSLFIIAAFFVLLNAVVFTQFLDGKKWLVFKETALPVFDNVYKLMGWFLLYMLFFAYLIRLVGGIFLICKEGLPLSVASFMGDFVLYFVLYFMVACIISLLRYQEIYIFANEKD